MKAPYANRCAREGCGHRIADHDERAAPGSRACVALAGPNMTICKCPDLLVPAKIDNLLHGETRP